ncbi:MAG: holo-ACP synthase [Calditrichota bacterium]
MIIGVGVDICEVSRIENELKREDCGFRNDVFTAGEIAYCESQRHPARSYAARFAAKEAVLKALGERPESGFFLREIETLKSPTGSPRLELSGRIKEIAALSRVRRIQVSLSHTDRLALAFVILES